MTARALKKRYPHLWKAVEKEAMYDLLHIEWQGKNYDATDADIDRITNNTAFEAVFSYHQELRKPRGKK